MKENGVLFPESDFHESASQRQTKLTCFQINSIGEQIHECFQFCSNLHLDRGLLAELYQEEYIWQGADRQLYTQR